MERAFCSRTVLYLTLVFCVCIFSNFLYAVILLYVVDGQVLIHSICTKIILFMLYKIVWPNISNG